MKTKYFEIYISKVLKSISSTHDITANAKQQLNSAMCIITKTIANLAIHLTVLAKKKTLSIKEVENAVKIIFTEKLTEQSIKIAEECVSKFLENDEKHNSRQDKAGILFPPSLTEKFLRAFGLSKFMVTKTAPVYLASVIEYLMTEIITEIIKGNNRVRINIRDVYLTIYKNKELCKLFEKCKINFLGGGVIPQIHEILLNKKPRKKRKNTQEEKKHKFRPGTVSLREIRKFQKTSNCLTFAKLPFEKFIRKLVNNYITEKKISKDVFIILQYYIEQFIVNFLQDANFATIHSGRVKLLPLDINFICQLRKYDELIPI